MKCEKCGQDQRAWGDGHWCIPQAGFPALAFNKDEWRMAAKLVDIAVTELDREDDIMAAVRDIARGG